MRAILVGVGQGSWELGRVEKHLGLVTSICPDCMFCRSEEPCAFSSPTSLTEHPLQQEQQHPQTDRAEEGGQSPQQPQPAKVALLEPSPEGGGGVHVWE